MARFPAAATGAPARSAGLILGDSSRDFHAGRGRAGDKIDWIGSVTGPGARGAAARTNGAWTLGLGARRSNLNKHDEAWCVWCNGKHESSEQRFACAAAFQGDLEQRLASLTRRLAPAESPWVDRGWHETAR